MNQTEKLDEYGRTEKVCAGCNKTIGIHDGHIMSMKPKGVRVYRCTDCGMEHIRRGATLKKRVT